MKRNPVAVGKAVKSALKDLGMERIIERYAIWDCWEEIVGREVAAHTRPEFFSGPCLFIKVDHSTWMHQLHFLKDQILYNLNRKLGLQAVSELRFRLSALPFQEQPRPKEVHRKARISKTERSEIEDSVRTIPSPEVRETLIRVMLKDLAGKKLRREETTP